MANFPYQPLDLQSYEIRLLELVVDHWGNFSGTLEHVSLVDPGPYIAMSYCWGDLDNYQQLGVSPSPGAPAFAVNSTDNLHAALWALWRRKEDNVNHLRIWVDAICINQNDIYERSQQVQFMRQIYSKATVVFAWVGPLGDEILSPETVENLARIIEDKSPVNPDSKAWDVLQDFFDEMYWKRVWIIQEITVARTVRVLYGRLDFWWDDVVSVLSMLVYSSSQDSANTTAIGASHLVKFHEHYVQKNKPISLLQAMSWTLHTEATDPRDKIFALLGLCHDGLRLVPVPNYRQSLESVIADMSRAMISLARSLDFICLKGSGVATSQHIGLPTWAPNWPNLWAGSTTIQENDILESPITFHFDPLLPSPKASAIQVQGFCVGHISGISWGLTSNGQQRQRPKDPSSWIHSTVDLIALEGAQVQKSWSTLSRKRMSILNSITMSYLGDHIEHSAASFGLRTLWDPIGRGSIYRTEIIEWIDQNAFFKIGPWTLREWSQLPSFQQPPEPLIDLLPSAVAEQVIGQLAAHVEFRPSTHRRPLANSPHTGTDFWKVINHGLEEVLGSGMRLAEVQFQGDDEPALVHPHAQVQDEIFLLEGCSKPVILRRSGLSGGEEFVVIRLGGTGIKQYQVVGAAWFEPDSPMSEFAHELVSAADKGSITFETLTLE